MTPGTEMLGNRPIRRQKTLGMARGFKPLHASLALMRRPMRILTPVIEIPTLAMPHPENLGFCRKFHLGHLWGMISR